MKILKLPIINALFVSLLSITYSFLFIFTSEHIEFLGLLSHTKTLKSNFWNNWSDFIRLGNMKYIGYAIIAITIIILILILLKKENIYDEYQMSILSKSLIVAGILSIIVTPLIIITLMSDPSYAIETMFLFVTIQWFGILITDILYIIK